MDDEFTRDVPVNTKIIHEKGKTSGNIRMSGDVVVDDFEAAVVC